MNARMVGSRTKGELLSTIRRLGVQFNGVSSAVLQIHNSHGEADKWFHYSLFNRNIRLARGWLCLISPWN